MKTREIVERILNDCVEHEEHEALRVVLAEYDRLKAEVKRLRKEVKKLYRGK